MDADLAHLVRRELGRWLFRLDDEVALQAQIAEKLEAAGFAITREVRLGPADAQLPAPSIHHMAVAVDPALWRRLVLRFPDLARHG